MIIFTLYGLTIFVIFVLGIFSIRRLFFALTTIFTKIDWSIKTPDSYRPFVSIFIPCYNEERVISTTLDALLKLQYPKDKLEIIVIDDGSSDNTFKIAQKYEKRYIHIRTFQRSSNDINRVKGKAAALNEALAKFTQGEFVYFIDADHQIKPDSLVRLVRYFSDYKVGAVSGRCIPRNKHDALISSYVYIESLVHYRITMYASDRLGLVPGVLGSNFCIRRSLLEKIGGFNEERLTEDVDLTVSIYQNGYIVKYDVTSISEHEAPDSIRDYILQHLRWNRGYNEVARNNWRRIMSNKILPLHCRIEKIIFSLGYTDRYFFFIALILTLLSLFVTPSFQFPFWVWLFFIGLPASEILIGLIVERESFTIYFRLPLILLMFSVDIYVALKGLFQDIARKPTQWYKTPRIGDKL